METIEKAAKHDFVIEVAPCNITGEMTKVIKVMLGTLDIEPDDGSEPQQMEVYATYSAEGLDMMKRALDSAPFPVDLPEPDGIRADTKYQWIVEFNDGSLFRQFPGDHHFGEFNPHDVIRLYLLPRDSSAGLPQYLWLRDSGIFRRENPEDPFKKLDLPFPSVPYHLEYQRRNTITFAAGPPGSDVFPTHVRHELGWRVDTLHGDAEDTWFIIGIEDDDGSWQIIKKEPENSRHFGPKVIEGSVRVIELGEAS